jgi:putative polyhydroxyalkanoate system protein
MPKLTIEQPHALPHPEVRQRLSTLEERLATKYGIEAKWVSDTHAEIKRTGATGFIRCTSDRVVVEIDLSFALSPVKSKVESRVREELARALGDSPDKTA